VVDSLEKIALTGKHRSYNVASGIRVEHQKLAEILHQTLGVEVTFSANGATRSLPLIGVERLQAEFGHPQFDIEREIQSTIQTMGAL